VCNFSAAEVDVHKLRNALEILSETEKQLKTTKNQSTWLTAALLQFNMREPYCLEALDDTAGSSMFTESQTGNKHSLPEKACFITAKVSQFILFIEYHYKKKTLMITRSIMHLCYSSGACFLTIAMLFITQMMGLLS
jgi:hypothetical protein